MTEHAPSHEPDESDDAPHVRLRRLGIDTHDERIIYMREDCEVCRSEGFEAMARVRVEGRDRSIIATLNVVTSDLLAVDEASLSEAAWRQLDANEGDVVRIHHPAPVESLSSLRSKVYGERLGYAQMHAIMSDIVAGRYTSAQISAFLTACAGDRMDLTETVHLTRAMIDVGQRLTWDASLVVDKHSVGGLPGNRTTPIVVAIVAANGLTMPKTSSRAITSPAGTADTMETLAPVNLDLSAMRRVVAQEDGCIVWGGAVRLSPADDILIRVERTLDLDSEGQMVASVLSKKAAAGSTHVVIDMPIGETAKVRSQAAADELEALMTKVGERIGLHVTVVRGQGEQPIGRGIGPALEARDVLKVLQGQAHGLEDLRDRAIELAGRVLEFSDRLDAGEGEALAARTLESGDAWTKFQAICEAQGGMREPPVASHTHDVPAPAAGTVARIDNRRLARVAKLAGAPDDREAGLYLHTPLGTEVERGDPLFTIHADTPGELGYALSFVREQPEIVELEPGT